MSKYSKLTLVICLVFALIAIVIPNTITAQDSETDISIIQNPDSNSEETSAEADDSEQQDVQATGLNEPTTEQSRWIASNFPVITNIRLNSLAVKRIRKEFQAAGLKNFSSSGMDVASLGDEVTFSDNTEENMTVTSATSLPGAVDNSTSPAFPPIRSQGTLSSCATWATTYYQFTYENNLARGQTASNGDNNFIFSPKWTYNIINGGTDGGSYFSDAYAVELKHGAATWGKFPYDSNYLEWCQDENTWRDAINYRPISQGQIYNSDTNILIESMKTQLANGHVLVIATYVSSWVQSVVANDPATALDDAFVNQKIASYMKNTKLGGHAMTVVGYNDNLWCDLNKNGKVDDGEKGALKIANSWGTGDWNSGYRWVSYDSLRSSSAAPSSGTWPATDRSVSGIFWSGNVFTLTANPDYIPSVVAAVTLNSAERGQLVGTLGTGSTTVARPSSTLTLGALNHSGGKYGFNGTSSSSDGSFFFDFSDLGSSIGEEKRWFFGIYDFASGNTTTIKSFKLYQVTDQGDKLLASAGNMPQSTDAGQIYSWVDSPFDATNQPPIAKVAASTLTGITPLSVTFDGSNSSDTDGQIKAFDWNFGDGHTGSGVNVAHSYTAAGNFTVKLTVTDDKRATGTSNVIIKATSANQPPVAVITTSASKGKIPLAVTFSGANSSDADGTIVTCKWNFGDGSTGTGSRVAHTYKKIGSYNAVLTVTDNKGAAGTASVLISATAANLSPVARISANVTSGKIPLVVTFNGLESSDEDGKIASYQWKFGDGTTGKGAVVSHTYKKKGTYTVQLTVTDDKKANSTCTSTVGAIASNYIKAPGALSATSKNKTVTLNWQDNSDDETAFYIEQWNGKKYVKIGTVKANITKYAQKVTSGEYKFRVQSYNQYSKVKSEYSNEFTILVK
jgi:PKD repeat protein/C1A family cysteine protease